MPQPGGSVPPAGPLGSGCGRTSEPSAPPALWADRELVNQTLGSCPKHFWFLDTGLENHCQCPWGKEVNQDLKKRWGAVVGRHLSTTYTCLTFAPDSFLLSEEWDAPTSLVLPSQRKQLTSAGPPVLCCFIARKLLLV